MSSDPIAQSILTLNQPQGSESDKAEQWHTWMTKLYISRKAPEPLGTVVFEEIEAKAREKLKDYPGAFMYAGGSAGTCTTYTANLAAFRKYAIIPRMLVNATRRDLSTTLFGQKFSSPLLLAPIGVQALFHPDAELAPAKASQTLGVPFIMSTASSRSIEQVAEANGAGERWYQLYWPKTDKVTVSILGRAKKNGYKVLLVTLDTMTLGFRPHDLASAYLPFGHGVGIEVGRSDPVFMGMHGLQAVTDHHPAWPYDPKAINKKFEAGDEETRKDVFLGVKWLEEGNSGLYRDWEDLKFLRENWEGRIVLKGIQSVRDAELAIQHGVDGIVVSNHGGRQVDGAIPSLYALHNIMSSKTIRKAQKEGKMTIFFDSGVRTGSDVLKAVAMGANGVLIGRPYLYASAIAGAAGIEQLIRHTMADVDTTLGLSGYRSLDELREAGLKAIEEGGEGVLEKVDV